MTEEDGVTLSTSDCESEKLKGNAFISCKVGYVGF